MQTDVLNEEEVLAWLAELFDEPLGNIEAGTARVDIANWDSLGVLTLMAELDERFQVNEPEVEEMKSVGDVIECLRKHGKLRSA